jgi:Na+-driven multidrug efflux pump
MGVIGDFMSLCHLLSGTYSIMTHSFVFQNLGGSLIVLYSLFRGLDVHRFEMIGTAISFVGCIITVLDASAKKVDSS